MQQSKLAEHRLGDRTELVEVLPENGPIETGPFRIELVRMAHSVPDNVGVVIETEGMRIFHTSDYKVDHTPVDGFKTDVGRLAELGNLGVDLFLGDSTNAERPGYTGSEQLVGDAFRQIIPLRKGRVLVASFASNVHRMQQAIDVALECGRKVCVVGRSMRKNLNIARALGYMEVPDDALVKPDELDNHAPDKVLVLCTGSQGEPLSALTRIAYHDHPSVEVERGDTVIISAKAVPGNELRARHDQPAGAGGGGGAPSRDRARPRLRSRELRGDPHGARPRAPQGRDAGAASTGCSRRRRGWRKEPGVPVSSIVLAENGSVVELSPAGVRLADRVESGVTFVDGLAVGDISDVALRDRRRLSEDEVVIVVATLSSSNGRATATPRARRAGFAEADELLDDLRAEAGSVLDGAAPAEHCRDQASPTASARRSRPGSCTTGRSGALLSSPSSSRYERRRHTGLGHRAHAARRRSRDGAAPRGTATGL